MQAAACTTGDQVIFIKPWSVTSELHLCFPARGSLPVSPFPLLAQLQPQHVRHGARPRPRRSPCASLSPQHLPPMLRAPPLFYLQIVVAATATIARLALHHLLFCCYRSIFAHRTVFRHCNCSTISMCTLPPLPSTTTTTRSHRTLRQFRRSRGCHSSKFCDSGRCSTRVFGMLQQPHSLHGLRACLRLRLQLSRLPRPLVPLPLQSALQAQHVSDVPPAFRNFTYRHRSAT